MEEFSTMCATSHSCGRPKLGSALNSTSINNNYMDDELLGVRLHSPTVLVVVYDS